MLGILTCGSGKAHEERKEEERKEVEGGREGLHLVFLFDTEDQFLEPFDSKKMEGKQNRTGLVLPGVELTESLWPSGLSHLWVPLATDQLIEDSMPKVADDPMIHSPRWEMNASWVP